MVCRYFEVLKLPPGPGERSGTAAPACTHAHSIAPPERVGQATDRVPMLHCWGELERCDLPPGHRIDLQRLF